MARHPVARKDGWPSGVETNVNRCISNYAAQKQSRSEVTALPQLPTRGSRHYCPEEPREKDSGEEGRPHLCNDCRRGVERATGTGSCGPERQKPHP